MPEFPENDVEILPIYLPAQLEQKLKDVRVDVRNVTVDSIATDPRNVAARSVNLARQALLSFLTQPTPDNKPDGVFQVQSLLDNVYVQVLAHDPVSALREIEKIFILPVTLDERIVRAALRREEIGFIAFEELQAEDGHGGSHPITIETQETLAGYNGPDLDDHEISQLRTLRELIAGNAERSFRIGVLRAECQLQLRQFDGAVEIYTDLLNAHQTEHREFLAVRCALAKLALGDSLFRTTRKPGDVVIAGARAAYTSAMTIVNGDDVTFENPLRQQIVRYAQQQLEKIQGHLNFLGFIDSFVPVQRPEFLENITLGRINAAKEAARLFQEYLNKANQLDDLTRELNSELQVAEKNVEIGETRVRAASSQTDAIDVQLNALAEKEESLVSQSISGIFGSFFGMAAAAAAAVLSGGSAAPAIGIGIAGMTSTVMRTGSELQDLRHQEEVARLQRRIAESQHAIAGFEKEIAQAKVEFVQRSLEITQGRLLSRNLCYTLARTFSELAENHLDAAIHSAYLYERSIAFELGVFDLTVVRFDYHSRLFAAPNELEDSVLDVKNRLLELPRRDEFVDIISLRSEYPIEFAQFLQSGEMDFSIPLYFFDKRRPGTHQVRIVGVDIEVHGIIPATGYTGTLTHRGVFILRDHDSTLDSNTNRLLPTDDELRTALAAVQEGRTAAAAIGGILLFDLGADTAQLDGESEKSKSAGSQTFTLNIFEGYGPTGLWNLALQNLNLRFIADIHLRLTLTSFETDLDFLGAKVKTLVKSYEEELAAGNALDRITPVSVRQQFRNNFAELLETGSTSILLTTESFPSDITDPKIKAVIAQTLNGDRRGVEGLTLEIGKLDTSFLLTKTTTGSGFTEDQNSQVTILGAQDRFPAEGTWQIRITDQTDRQKLRDGDLLLFFLYTFKDV